MPDSDSATQDYMETTDFVSGQKNVNFVDLCNQYIEIKNAINFQLIFMLVRADYGP